MIKYIFIALFIISCGTSSVNVDTNTVAKNGTGNTDTQDACDYKIDGSQIAGYSVTVVCSGEVMSIHNFTTLEDAREFIEEESNK